MVTRGMIAETLRRWQAGELTAREAYDWAQERYWPGRVEFDDWEADDSSAANEVLCALDALPMNLILPEDMPAYLEFLATPSGRFAEGYERFRAALDRIDYAAPARSLRKDDFYGRSCGADGCRLTSCPIGPSLAREMEAVNDRWRGHPGRVRYRPNPGRLDREGGDP